MQRTCALLLVVAGCGGNDHAQVDAPVHSPDAAVDARPIDAPAMRRGLVQLGETTFMAMASSSSTIAFADGDPMGTTLATDGPCASYPTGGGTRYSAGTIDVTGTSQAIAFTPSGTAPTVVYAHTPSPLPTDLFTASATLHVTAAGGPGFGAFAGDITAPTTVVFTPPATLSRAGQTISWTAGTGNIVQVALVTSNALILCRVPDSGSFAVPASTFALIPIGDTNGVVAVARTMEHELATTSGPVTLQALSAIGGTITLAP